MGARINRHATVPSLPEGFSGIMGTPGESMANNATTQPLLEVLVCFIDPMVRKIKNEASSCPEIVSRLTLIWRLHLAPPGGSHPRLLHLHDRYRGLAGDIEVTGQQGHAQGLFCMYVSFKGWRLTKTRLTLINRTRLRTKGQSAGYSQAQIGITSNSFQRRAP